MNAHLRIARPTNRLAELTKMYREGLGLDDLGGFEGHDGFDGAMLGTPGSSWHLEFTQQAGHSAPPAPSPENLLVLYYPSFQEWTARCRQMTRAGFKQVSANNPYWDRNGKTFEDPDGYRVVVTNSGWD